MTAASFPAHCACGKPAQPHRNQCAGCQSRERRAASRLGCRVCGAPTLPKRVRCAEHRLAPTKSAPPAASSPRERCRTEGCPNARKVDKTLCGPCVYQQALNRRSQGTDRECKPFVCACGVPASEHVKCGGCGKLAGDGDHIIPVAELQPWGDETDLCWSCRRARDLRGVA
jgi:hypothetical protein